MWDIFYVREECIEGDPYFHIVTDILAMTIQIITRRCSSLLALFIAAFRAFSVIFPMSNAVNFMMKAKSGYLIVLFVASVCTGWGAYFLKQTRIEFVRKDYIDDLDIVAIVLVIINSCNHCIICFFMSSQYRDVVRRLVCCCKKEENVEKVAVVESEARPTTKTTKVSNGSRKTS
ncbi:hypothetical protein CAEBREN_29644 [Caenorhabditis brenneri]|uniref:Uncharacterized protein n=1 Tax=Caenorhabditis brenneri TaxID=135651 RepID=G0PFB9_CAEBE|nr:hypothetical protein CAEBREN_29644 [Caenorhabditis brenneri]